MHRRPLLLETCEDRILCSAAPNVTLAAPATAKIGETVSVTATFDNTAGTNAGFGPYIDVVVDKTGADGNDGLTFQGATYLGATVTSTVLTFDASGNATHPYAKNASGAALVIAAPPGYGVGDQLIVLQLPFGSFTPQQPGAAVDLSFAMSNLADVSTPLQLSAKGGFQYGNDALDNPATDPSIVDASYANASVTPTLFTLTKTYLGPEDETATGPNYLRQYQIDVDIAQGQTISSLVLADLLPSNMQFFTDGTHPVEVLKNGASTGATATSTPSTTTPGGTLSRTLTTSVTGDATSAADATLRFWYFVPRLDSTSAVIVNATSGNDVTALNNASTSGAWDPLDVRDGTGLAVALNPVGTEHTLTAKSIATQKSVALVTDTGAVGATPGDTLEYTIQVQVSDYFAFQNLVLTDLFSDGQRLDGTFTPTFTFTEHGSTSAAAVFNAANYAFTLNADNNPATPATDGSTTITFNLSNEMLTRGFDAKLLGGGLPNGGTGAGALPNNPALPFGATTATVTFRTVIQDKFSDTYPSGDADVNARDVLTNDVTVSGDLLAVNNVTTLTGQSEADTSTASVAIVNTTVAKTIYAVNGAAPVIGSNGKVLIAPGDTVTYRLTFTVPTGDVENLTLADYLPLPVFDATTVTTFQDVISAAAPAAGFAKFGPSETLRAAHGSAPTIATNAAQNTVTFNYGTTNDPTNAARTVDLLFTVTASSEPFADGLFLTNQVRVSENNTQQPATTVVSDAIVQTQLQEPSVAAIGKGVVGYETTGLTLGGIVFADPSAASTFTGTVANAAQATAIGASNLLGLVDAGDTVRYAIVLQNTGSSDAFDVAVSDQVPADYVLPGVIAGLNLIVRHGDGSLVNPADYATTYNAGTGAFTITFTDNYSAGNTGSETKQGVLSRGYDAETGSAVTNGSNTLVITYDVTLKTTTPQTRSTITNTATLTNYAGSDGGTDFTTTNPTDTAAVQLVAPTLTKVLTGTEVTTGNNSATQAVIGELATYTLTITVPDGSTPSAQIADTLDAGLAFVDLQSVTLSGGVTTANTIGTGTAPGNVTIGGSGRNLTFNFGNITNSNDTGAAETITIVYRAVVLDLLGVQAATLLNNSAVFSAQTTDQPGGSPQSYSLAAVSANNLTVIEPTLAVTKGVGSAVGGPFAATLPGADAGDTVFYQIQITNAASQPTAFELFLSDTLPAGLTGLSIASVTGTGFGSAPIAGDFQIAGSVLSINAGGPLGGNIDVPGGATLTIIVQGTLASTVQPAQTLSNTATIRWSSLDGSPGTRSIYNASATERSGGTLTPAAGVNASTDPAILDNYAATSASAGLTILSPAPVKTIDATSEAGTTSVSGTERVAIGEIVRYRVVWQMPEGTANSLAFTDQLPSGLQFLNDGTATLAFVSSGGNISSSVAAIGSSASVAGDETTLNTINPQFVIPGAQITGGAFGNGTDPVFNLGNVLNPDSDGNQEFVVIEFNAVVLNVTGSQRFNNVTGVDTGAVNLDNSVNVATATSTQTSSAVTVRIAEPAITNVTKSVSGGPYDAGDVLTYTVTFSNVNDADAAPAYDVVLTDAMAAAFFDTVTFVSATASGAGAVTGLTGGAAGNTVTVNVGSMTPNSTITVVYTARLVTGIQANQAVANTASVIYTSLPGSGTALDDGVAATTNSTPGAAGTATGERTGSGGAGSDATVLNNFADSGSASLNVGGPTLDKTFRDGAISADDTSVASTSGASVVVGEQVIYDILVTLPEGLTRALAVLDAVPAGLRIDALQILTTAAAAPLLAQDFSGGFASSPTLGTAFTGAGNLTFTFGDTTLPADNVAGNNSFVIRVTGTVLDIAANQSAVTRSNTATLQYLNPNTSTTATVADSTPANDPVVTLVEPALTISKSVSTPTPDAGDALSYTITLTNTSGQTAFDVVLSDLLPAAFSSPTVSSVTKSGAGSVFVNGVATTPLANTDVIISGGTLQFAGGSNIAIGTGVTLEFVVSGTVGTGAGPGQAVTNTANTTWTSTDGANADERTGAGGIDDYAASAGVSFTVPAAAFAKQLFATSEASTTGSNVTIGERVTYALVVTLPEGTTPDLTITDLLPPGLIYASTSIVTAAAASGGLLTADFAGTVPAPAITGGAAAGDDVTYTFGAITVAGDNDATTNRFLVLITARVVDVAGNAGVTPPGQTVLANSASFDISTDGAAATATGPVNVTVVEPRMTITKDIVPASGDAGDTLTITLTVGNTGTSSAFDTTVEDPLDLTRFDSATLSFSSTAAGFTPGFNAGSGLVQFSGGTIAAGGSAVFTFTVALRADLQPGQTISNTATVTQATTLPGADVGERSAPTVNAADTVSVPKVLTLAKTVLTTSQASTTGNNIAIGETATFRLALTVQDGVTPQVTVTDSVPAGLRYVAGSAIFRSADGVTATGAVSGTVYTDGTVLAAADLADATPGGNLVFSLINVTAPASAGLDADAFQIDYTLLAQNLAGNQAGTTRANSASATSPALALTTAASAQTLTVVEPALSLTKTLVTGGTDAGDAVQYTLTITNASGATAATAFDIRVLDTLSANLVLGSVTVSGATVSADSTAGNALDLTLAQLAAGATATITVNATVAATAPAGATIGNSAALTYTSVPGADANERTGSGGVNDYAASSTSANFTLGQPAIVKLGPADTTYAIGETPVYRIVVTLPEGVTQNVSVRDLLPVGLEYLSASLDFTGSGVTPFVLPAPTVTGDVNSGTQVAFSLGTLTNAADNNAANNSFTIVLTARAADLAGNVQGTPRTNDTELDYTHATSGAQTINAPADPTITIVEPKLQIAKAVSDTTPDIGQVLTFTLTLTHTGASAADAFDLVLRDLTPAGLTLNLASIAVSGATVDADNSTAAGLDLQLAALALGGTVTVTYQATVDNTLAGVGGSFTNNARLYWDSLAADETDHAVLNNNTPDGTPDRDYGATPGFTENATPGVDDPAQDTVGGTINTNAIAGTVYRDNDSNGALSGGDTRLVNVALTLTGTTATGLSVSRSTTTDASGNYSFGNLAAGTYLITETQPAGYIDGVETAGAPATTFGGTISAAPGSDIIAAITIPAQSNATEGSYNFGETLVSSLAGSVYLDDDNDGARDAGETGLVNVPVTLTGTDIYGQAVSLAGSTDADGRYTFANLRPGNYAVTENDAALVPATYLDGKDTAGTSGGTLAGGSPKFDQIAAVALAQNTAATGYNFGELRPATLAGAVFLDTDNDAAQGVGETGIGGATITLTGTDDRGAAVNVTTVTAGDGTFSFTALRPGTYTLTETQPAGFGDGQDAVGTLGGTLGNDVLSSIALAAGQSGTDYTFGERLSGIRGTVFLDANTDSALNPGETGLGGVTLTLLDGTNTPIATTTTAADGTYAFAGVSAGNYTVVQTQPGGYGSSTPDSVAVVVPPGGSAVANFGETVSALAGRVYFDADASGARSAGDTDLSGVIVTLNGTDVNGAAVARSTNTAADGSYIFTGLLAGTYTLSEAQPPAYADGAETVGTAGGTLVPTDSISGIALPVGTNAAGYNFGEIVSVPPGTGGIAGTVFYDRDVDAVIASGEPGIAGVTLSLRDVLGNVVATTTTAADGSYVFTGLAPGTYRVVETQPAAYGSSTPNTITPITVTAGAVVANQNFGETSGSLAGSVYFDANDNGVRDGGEAGIAGVTVTLAGTDYHGAAVNRTVTTDTNGAYVFTELLGGTYDVTETQPAGIADGLDAAGTSGGTLGNDAVTNIGLGGGVNATAYNFGERPALLSGTVFVDADRNGARNGGESGLAGVTVTLLDGNGVPVGSTVTAADGSYRFAGLAPGSYTVVETQPGGYGSSTANARPVTVPAGGLTGVDFGETTASLAGRVFVDADASGGFSAGDGGIGSATLTLTGTDTNGAAVSRTVTTAADGSYLFTGLLAGTYRVNETQPAGYADGADVLGTAGGANSANDEFSGIGLGAGAQATGYDFGETVSTPPGTGALGGTVFRDRNQDGTLGAAEPGIGGVTLELRDSGNALVATTTTAADGTYLFTGITPGAGYRVEQTQPTGYGSSTANTLSGLTVANGAFNGGNNFGETFGALAGNVFLDRDTSGTRTAGDTGIGGVTVALTGTDANGAAVSHTTTTAADGSYRFDDLLAGTYALAETPPAAYADGAETAGSPGGSTAVNDTISGIALAAGQSGVGHDFGELGAQLSGTVYVDADKGGTRGGGESGLGGVTLQLRDAGGGIVGTAVTALDGSYTFSNLPAGNYTVVQTQPGAYGSSTPNSVATSVPVGGLTGVDFGETTGSLAGTVYHDLNNNGALDVGEPRIVGATITLTGTDLNGAAVVATTLTDGTGGYRFTGLLAGTYTLAETQPAGYRDGRETAGTTGGNTTANDAISAIGVGAGNDESGYLFAERTAPDLVVTKDDGLDSVVPGEEITYTITLSNVGLQQADGVVVSDQFPTDRLEFVAASAGGVFDAGAGTITWNLGEITGSGAEVVTLTITARVKVPVPAGAETVDNVVTATDDGSSGPDATPDNNTATDTDPLHAAPDLYLLKTDGLAEAKVGQQITYTLTGGNAGDQTAGGVIVSDALPPGLRFLTASAGGRLVGGQVVWNLGDLAPGATFQLTVTVLVEAPAGGKVVVNPATITDRFGAREDPTPLNNVASDPTRIIASNTSAFAFDSFNDFSRHARRGGLLPSVSSPDIFRDALLPLAPIYSGEADPGSTLVVSLYNAKGENIGAQTVLVDAGGNWLASFPSTTVRDLPNSVRISQLSASYSRGDTVGHNLRTYFSPALNQGHFFLSTADSGLNAEPAPLLSGLGLENPLQLGSVKYGGELLSTQATAGGY